MEGKEGRKGRKGARFPGTWVLRGVPYFHSAEPRDRPRTLVHGEPTAGSAIPICACLSSNTAGGRFISTPLLLKLYLYAYSLRLLLPVLAPPRRRGALTASTPSNADLFRRYGEALAGDS